MKVENDFRQLNIRQIQYNNKQKGFNPVQKNYQSNPNFTGGFDMFLRFLDTSPAWGACAVDLGCMVIPRTLTDFSRGADAGMETMRREGMGTTNHSLVGMYGTLAGLALAAGINGAYNFGKNDIKAGSIFADSETLDLHGKIYDEKLKAAAGNTEANPIREYLKDTLKRYEVMTDDGKWVKIKDTDIEKTANILEQEIRANSNKLAKGSFTDARNILMSSVGAENNFRIIAEEGKKPHSSRYSVDYIVENLYKLGKVFTKDKVKEAFMAAGDSAENAFLKAIKSMNIKRSLIGVGIASAVGVSAQPLNMYITKKKTGNSGFVGGGKEDNSVGFKLRKSLVAGLFGAGVLATIGNPKNLVKDLQFKGFTPSLKQFKFIYGITIMSRFLSSRNDNELKECSIKDTLGFANWLILGNFVQKLVAQGLDKSLIKRNGKGVMNWITDSVLKSRDEVLHNALGNRVFKDGKALSYNEMVKLADKATKKKLGILTVAQLAGYAYSGIVLGRLIPKLNIYLTNRREAKEAAKLATEQKNQPSQQVNGSAISSTGAMKVEDFINHKSFNCVNV